jgi:integrase
VSSRSQLHFRGLKRKLSMMENARLSRRREHAELIIDVQRKVSALPGEAENLKWTNVYLRPAVHAALGYIAIRDGETKNAKRNLSPTARAAEVLKARKAAVKSEWVFPTEAGDRPMLGTYPDRLHDRVRTRLGLPKDFVLHSLRHTMLTRLGEAGAAAFTIMRIAGHSSVTVSQRYVHPTPERMERAFDRLQQLNAAKFEQAAAEVQAEAVGMRGVGTKMGTAPKPTSRESAQVVEFKRTGP